MVKKYESLKCITYLWLGKPCEHMPVLSARSVMSVCVVLSKEVFKGVSKGVAPGGSRDHKDASSVVLPEIISMSHRPSVRGAEASGLCPASSV